MDDVFLSKDIYELCRLCLNDSRILQDVFAPSAPDHQQNSLLFIEKITDSTSIKIIEADELPSKVCYECCEQIEKIFKFRQKCRAVDSLLRKHVQHNLPQKTLGGTPLSSPGSFEDSFLKEERGGGDEETEFELVPGTESEMSKFDSETLLEVKIKEEGEETPNDSTSSCEGLLPKTLLTKSRTNPKSTISLKGKKYVCQLCGKNFCNNYSLTRHKWSHSKKTSSCQFCNKIFQNRESRLRHEKMHQEGNRYRCHLCDKSYVSSTSHAAHVRKHTGERPFKCSDCDETFYLISSFERHVAKHRGVKDYECEICSASFWVADDLRAHVNRMH